MIRKRLLHPFNHAFCELSRELLYKAVEHAPRIQQTRWGLKRHQFNLDIDAMIGFLQTPI
jgi:hypothetical protein